MTSPGMGHNGVSAEKLKSFVQRIELLNKDKQDIADNIKEVFCEAKGEGFDIKTLRKVIGERKKSAQERQEQLELFEMYAAAIGMDV